MSQLGFDFGVQQRKLSRVTPARLSTFVDCPRRYRMTYLDRPAPRRTGAWANSTLGAVVHNALRALFLLPAAKRTPARAAALVSEHWKDAGFLDAQQAAHYRERAKGWVAEYVEHQDVSIEPVGLERWVSARAGSDGSASATMIVEGRVDRIDERGGELVIVDYKTGGAERLGLGGGGRRVGKTGRRMPDERDAGAARALALYAVAAEQELRAPCRRVELHHLPSNTVAGFEHTRASLDRHLVEAEETADAVRVATDTLTDGGSADELFPARTGGHCAACDFRPSCAPGQAAAPAARSWDLLAP
ncbi:PD-(D/E)XK nuclease superfamily protein [Amycolatopsis marina]|uniref:PD-(D/E)XK nuclease superfamily protein n=1 Tax=Amycolatopsis marina TaxID=490629 RepID=A0A1I1BMV9_9PSEU|nr:PD-(D/E)XK nuclease family protein [Amycolatopsis marina]SFB51477.1 PD-(D/E)XK nuclease superfamily protein [Amycolatopsis marina]